MNTIKKWVEKHLSPEDRHKIIDDLRLIKQFNNRIRSKIMNLLDNTPNEWSKFRTKNRVEINDHARW